jgi:hypothetical protein
MHLNDIEYSLQFGHLNIGFLLLSMVLLIIPYELQNENKLYYTILRKHILYAIDLDS